MFLRHYLFIALVIVSSSFSSKADPTADELKAGFDLATKVAQEICWYEYLKILPDYKEPKSNKFGGCFLNVDLNRLIEIWKAKDYKVNEYKFIKKNMGTNINKFVKRFLPEGYHDDCRTYMLDPMSEFEKEHPLVEGKKVPFAGWASCMLDQLEDTRGPESIEAIKTKWAQTNVKWTDVLLARENENRKRHGSDPLRIDDQIQASAQKLANEMVEACENYSEVLINHDMTFNEEFVGLSMYFWALGAESPPQNDALFVANTWYEAGQNYTWPVYKKDGSDGKIHKFGQFSQTVWKGTQRVGYGMGKNPNCAFTIFIGKYIPRGNVVKEFGTNVFPVQE